MGETNLFFPPFLFDEKERGPAWKAFKRKDGFFS